MTIITVLALILMASVIVNRTTTNFDGETFSLLCSVFAAIFLFLCGITICINRLEVTAHIQGFEAIRSSRAMTEKTPSIEAAAWRMKVADANEWLAETKYWNSTAFDIWTPDTIEAVRPIE
jgi:hypothetical protein